MENLFLYLGKVFLTSFVLFGYYHLFLKDKSFHRYNRFYLLASASISVILPFLKLSYFTISVHPNLYLMFSQFQSHPTNSVAHDVPYFQILSVLCGLVSVFFLVRFSLSILKIRKLKKAFPKENFQGIQFYNTNLPEAPFSYFRNLFWKSDLEMNSRIGMQILKHEMVHIEQKHSWDKVLIEFLCSVFWMNPVFYFIKKERHLIHEYLADANMVQHSDTKAFAEMILASQFQGSAHALASPFINSNIKKRLIMLKKPKTKFSYIRRIAVLPVLFLVGFVCLVRAKNQEITLLNQEVKTLLKTDTLVPKSKTDTLVTKKRVVLSQEIPEEQVSKQLSKISSNLKKSSSELKSLKSGTPEFSKKVEEIEHLSDQISEWSASQPSRFDFPKITVFSDSIRMKLDSHPELLKSKDFQMLLEQAKGKIKTMIITKGDKGDVQIYSNNSDVLVDPSKSELRAKAAENSAKKAELSAKDAEKLAKLAEQKANLMKKQAEINRKMAEIRKDSLSNKLNQVMNKTVIIYKDKNADQSSEDINYYLNGKKISKTEMDLLKPDQIKSINVKKVPGIRGELYIETK